LSVFLGRELVVYVGSAELFRCFVVGHLYVGFIFVIASSCCVWVALSLGDSKAGGLGAKDLRTNTSCIKSCRVR
jgi:hypothetical protein